MMASARDANLWLMCVIVNLENKKAHTRDYILLIHLWPAAKILHIAKHTYMYS